MIFPSYNAINNTNRNSVAIIIERPAASANANNSGREAEEVKIEIERMKTIYAFLLATFSVFLNDLTLSYVNELVPEGKPLPDFIFTFAPYLPWALLVSEWLLLSSALFLFILVIAHKYRWIVLRRLFIIGSLISVARCATMFLTQVPIADEKNKYCAPKLPADQRTIWHIVERALSTFLWQGLQVFNGGNMRNTLCGDYIFSGHSAALITIYLFIREYSPRRWFTLHYISMCSAIVAVVSIVLSRGHYSLDVLIAYWITTRTFWIYHILANSPKLREDLPDQNYLTKFIWFPLFMWMEGNMRRPIPRKYECPLPPAVRNFLTCGCKMANRNRIGDTHTIDHQI